MWNRVRAQFADFIKYLRTEDCGWHAGAEGAQIVELAVALPLLVVVAVGIMDFGAAFNLKHKLDNAVQEGTRVASIQPTADITNQAPASTEAVRQAVDRYLVAENINDCGLATAGSNKAALAWTYQASDGCPATLVLTIDRGAVFRAGAPPITVEATQVSISYPFQWRFDQAIRLLVPTASYTGITQIKTVAIEQNLN
jgi:Flp pilus assembly protein TadG